MKMHFLVIAFCSFILCSCSKEENNNSVDYQTRIVSSNWEMLWSDEFDGEELDLSKWNKLRWKPGWVNNELQAYTDRDTNIFLENGHLVLQGNIEPGYSGTDYVGNNLSLIHI